jgi:hypothetical protein
MNYEELQKQNESLQAENKILLELIEELKSEKSKVLLEEYEYAMKQLRHREDFIIKQIDFFLKEHTLTKLRYLSSKQILEEGKK